jgi:hypothetical protein
MSGAPYVVPTEGDLRFEKAIERRKVLLSLIADSYKRQATNRSQQYRAEQSLKCKVWLDELTDLWESEPLSFNAE